MTRNYVNESKSISIINTRKKFIFIDDEDEETDKCLLLLFHCAWRSFWKIICYHCFIYIEKLLGRGPGERIWPSTHPRQSKSDQTDISMWRFERWVLNVELTTLCYCIRAHRKENQLNSFNKAITIIFFFCLSINEWKTMAKVLKHTFCRSNVSKYLYWNFRWTIQAMMKNNVKNGEWSLWLNGNW